MKLSHVFFLGLGIQEFFFFFSLSLLKRALLALILNASPLSLLLMHLHMEKISESDLSDVVANIFIILEIGLVDVEVSRIFGSIRLVVHQLVMFHVKHAAYHFDAFEIGMNALGILPGFWSCHPFTPGG